MLFFKQYDNWIKEHSTSTKLIELNEKIIRGLSQENIWNNLKKKRKSCLFKVFQFNSLLKIFLSNKTTRWKDIQTVLERIVPKFDCSIINTLKYTFISSILNQIENW